MVHPQKCIRSIQIVVKDRHKKSFLIATRAEKEKCCDSSLAFDFSILIEYLNYE